MPDGSRVVGWEAGDQAARGWRGAAGGNVLNMADHVRIGVLGAARIVPAKGMEMLPASSTIICGKDVGCVAVHNTPGLVGALLVGEPTERGLVFRGRVGSGLAGNAGERVAPLLTPLATDASPFVDPVPKEDAVGARCVRPELVVEVASLGFTPQHRLRQPAYLGLRADVSVDDLGVADA